MDNYNENQNLSAAAYESAKNLSFYTTKYETVFNNVLGEIKEIYDDFIDTNCSDEADKIEDLGAQMVELIISCQVKANKIIEGE